MTLRLRIFLLLTLPPAVLLLYAPLARDLRFWAVIALTTGATVLEVDFPRGLLPWQLPARLRHHLVFYADLAAMLAVVYLTGGVRGPMAVALPMMMARGLTGGMSTLQYRLTVGAATALYGGINWALYGAGGVGALFWLHVVVLFATSELIHMGVADRHRLIDALGAANAHLRELSIRDHLTGLYNHRYLQERLAAEMDRAVAARRPLSLAMLDLDNFKRYNDTYGHLAGDNLLRDVAGLLVRTVPAGAPVCRYGGEEMAVLLPGLGPGAAAAVAETLRAAVAGHPFPGRPAYPHGGVTVSVGVASYPANAGDRNALVHAADQALYRAKASGRNQVAAPAEGESPPLAVVR